MTKGLRLVGYLRVSRVAGREGERFISPAVQRERIGQYASLRGHEVTEWVEDLDQPGSRYERPGLQRALEAVERGEADGVAVAKLDRLARSVVDGGVALRRLHEAGGSLVLVDEGLDTSTPTGRAMFTIMLAFAELELDRIRGSWEETRRRAIGRGVHIGQAPVGYRRGEDGRLEPDPVAAPIVREVFLRRAAGASWRELGEFLDERLPREGGGRWTRSTLTSLIGRRTYLGVSASGDVVNRTAHEPLVSRAEWEQAQGQVSRPPRSADEALLTGLVSCGSCGRPMTRSSHGTGRGSYVCRKVRSDGVCPAPVKISVRLADAYAEREFLAWAIAQDIAFVGEPRDDAREAAVLRLEAAEAELDAYRDAELVSVIGREAYVSGLANRQRAIDEARAEVSRAEVVVPLARRIEFGDLWPELEVRERRAVLAAAFERIECRRAGGSGQGTSADKRLRLVWKT